MICRLSFNPNRSASLFHSGGAGRADRAGHVWSGFHGAIRPDFRNPPRSFLSWHTVSRARFLCSDAVCGFSAVVRTCRYAAWLGQHRWQPASMHGPVILFDFIRRRYCDRQAEIWPRRINRVENDRPPVKYRHHGRPRTSA